VELETCGVKLGMNLNVVQSLCQCVKVDPFAILQLEATEPSPSLIVAAIVPAIYPSPTNFSQRRNHDEEKPLPTLSLLSLRALPVFGVRTLGSRPRA
jgi:hypothetical protein